MRIVLPGGSGQLGSLVARHLHAAGNDVTVLSRHPAPAPWKTLPWDGVTLDPAWTHTLEGADAVIHLSGKSVNCRYNAANKQEIIDSRVKPTLAIGRAIEESNNPPKVWMNASTSTFYRTSFDQTQDEFTGQLGSSHDDQPDKWNFSIEVARRWEEAFYTSITPRTRKLALRTSMTMSPDPGGVFSVMLNLVRFGLGGTQGSGKQWVSWIHGQDYTRALDFLLAHPEISGPVNLTAPNPLPNKDFMRAFRQAWRTPVGLPATEWMLEIGAVFLRTETELILKSRRAVPTVLLKNGFHFNFPTWPEAAHELVQQFNHLKH